MLDIKFIRENPEKVKEALRKKKAKGDVEKILELDEKRRKLIQEIENLTAMQNKKSAEIVSASPDKKEEIIKEMQNLKERIKNLNDELKGTEEVFLTMMYALPNIPLDDVPEGEDENDNQVIEIIGEPTRFDFPPRDHVELGKILDIIDIETAGKVVGSRFYYLKNEAVLLEFALIKYTYNVLTSPEKIRELAKKIRPDYPAKPFIPVLPPVMIKPEIYRKMARLSEEDKDERYYLPQDDLYLIGSAEHTLGPMHLDQILDEKDLPIRYLGFSPAFRREAGSYGKDVRGILRVHQFDKIEMESFTLPEDSLDEQNFIVEIQKYLVASLGLPFRVVMICTGDMGKPDARQIDIETWLPGQNRYRETHTSDLMTDYQARRLNTRVRRKNGKINFVHMNDATAFAIGRILIAILENYQEKDGSVRVPEVLIPYCGFSIIKPKK